MNDYDSILESLENADGELKKITSKFGLSNEEMTTMIQLAREEVLYLTKHGIIMDKVNVDDSNNFHYYISIPHDSDYKSKGEELALEFKEFMIEHNKKSHKDVSELGVVVHYIERDVYWSEEDSKNAVNETLDRISKNPIYPFGGDSNG